MIKQSQKGAINEQHRVRILNISVNINDKTCQKGANDEQHRDDPENFFDYKCSQDKNIKQQ